MTWSASPRRGDVLRAVIAEAEGRQDGTLPTDVDGVAETFHDDLDLVAALLLRWHARLAGAIERHQMDQPMDLEGAVVEAWAEAAEENSGLRAVLDHAQAHPLNEQMATALQKAQRKSWTTLALMAGKCSVVDERAVRIGRRIEERARLTFSAGVQTHSPVPAQRAETPTGGEPVVKNEAESRTRFVDRLKAAIAAA